MAEFRPSVKRAAGRRQLAGAARNYWELAQADLPIPKPSLGPPGPNRTELNQWTGVDALK